MKNTKRRQWNNKDNVMLQQYWDTVGSVILIALILDRTASSVQTQASRLNLPRRKEAKEKHRRKWSEQDEQNLQIVLNNATSEEGRISIEQIAKEMERSVDAIAAKLIDIFEDKEELLKRLIIPVPPPLKNKKRKSKIKPYIHIKAPKKVKCIICDSIFEQVDESNLVCDNCKKEDKEEVEWNW